jgi:hypothetical protein
MPSDEILESHRSDVILERLGELMRWTTSPTIRAILLEAADEIVEISNEDSDENTELEEIRRAA